MCFWLVSVFASALKGGCLLGQVNSNLSFDFLVPKNGLHPLVHKSKIISHKKKVIALASVNVGVRG